MAIPLQYDIFARDRASGTFDKVGRSMDRANRSSTNFGRSFAGVGVAIGSVAAGAAVAVGALGVAGAALGLKTAASLQQAQISYETLLGSAKKAQAFLGQMTAFAARTPFQTTDVINYSRALLGAGQAAKDILPTLTAWGDTSGALGQTQEQFGRTMTAVTQIMNKGKLQAEELMQISESGIPIWGELSKALGMPIPAIQELMKEGKLLSGDVLPALQAQLEKDYGGAMGRQAKTLSGLWSTFKDTLSLGLAKVMSTVMPILSENMPGAMKVLGDALNRFAIWMKSTGVPAIREFVGWLRDDLWPALKQLGGDYLAGLTGAFRNFFAALGGKGDAGTAFDSISTALKSVGDFLTNVVMPAMGKLYRDVLPALGTALGQTVVIAFNLGMAFLAMADTAIKGFNSLAVGAVNSMGMILHAADKVRFLFGPVLAGVIHQSASGFDDWAHSVKAKLKNAEGGIASLRESFLILRNQMYGIGASTGANYVAGLTAAMVAGAKGSIAAAQGTVNKLQSQAEDVLGAPSSVTSPTADSAKSKKAGKAAKVTGVAIGTGLADGLSSTAGKVGDAGQKLADAAKAKFDEIKQAAESLRDSVKDSVLGFFSLQTEGNPFAGLTAMANKAVRFAHALAKLSKQGVNPNVIAMIAQAGPDVGLRAAIMLSTAGKANRGRIDNAYERIDKAATRAGNIVTGAMYDDQLGVAKKSERHLKRIADAVTRGGKGSALANGWAAY